MKRCMPCKVAIPLISKVHTKSGETYLIGGLSDAGIKRFGAEITKGMLAEAKRQRAKIEGKRV